MKIINAVNKNSIVINNKNYPIHFENSQKDDLLGSKILGLVCHWTAGDYDDFYDGYHFNIGFINNEVIVVKTLGNNQKGQHVWGRNTGMIGITLCAMKDWILEPNQYQLDIMSILIAEICAWKNLNPESKISLPKKQVQGDTLITLGGTQSFNLISDHREFAIADGYPSERQDINNSKKKIDYMVEVRAKAIKYYKELKANKRNFLFVDIIK